MSAEGPQDDGPQAEGPQEVTVERIEALFLPELEGSIPLKRLLCDMLYHTSWVHDRVKRNREVLKEILEHVDFHGEKPPTL